MPHESVADLLEDAEAPGGMYLRVSREILLLLSTNDVMKAKDVVEAIGRDQNKVAFVVGAMEQEKTIHIKRAVIFRDCDFSLTEKGRAEAEAIRE